MKRLLQRLMQTNKTRSGRFLTSTLFLLLLIVTGFVQARPMMPLVAGDIAFVGLNSDGVDDFAFVALVPLPFGTTINFIDEGWNDIGGFFSIAGDNPVPQTWNAPIGGVPAGTVIVISTAGADAVNIGTLTGTDISVFSNIGDQMFAFTGLKTAPNFLAGIHHNLIGGTTDANWDGAATNNSSSALPDALVNGSTAIRLYDPLGPTELDNFIYDCSVTSGDAATLRTAIYNLANWNIDLTNTTPYTLNPFPCSFTVSAPPCTDPDVPTVSASPDKHCPPGGTSTLSITGGNLNDATDWQWYTGSCGGTNIGNGTSISVSPTSTTTYFVRGEGGCVTPGTCAMVTVTVSDDPPTAICQNITVYIPNGGGTVIAFPTDVDNGSSDDCGAVSLSLSPSVFDCTDLGDNAVVLTVTDNMGQMTTCNAIVAVADTTDPVPDVASLPTITGQCTAQVLTTPTATDNCAGTINGTTSDPTTYNTQGTFTITWTYDDGEGNTTTQTQTVIVDDTTPPVPDVASLPDVTGECSATIPGPPTATDNCDGAITGTTSDPLTYTTQGTFTVTWTYTDAEGNSSTQTQTVIVDDVTPPVAVCQDLCVYLDGTGNATINAQDLSVAGGPGLINFDAIFAPLLFIDQEQDACLYSNPGVSFIGTWEVLSVTTFAVTGLSNPNKLAYNDVFTDSTETIQFHGLASGVSFKIADPNNNSVLTAHAYDSGGGLLETHVVPLTPAAQTITFVSVGIDHIDLSVAGPVGNIAGCLDDLVYTLIGSSDNCGIASYAATQTTFTCADLGANTVTLTITDVGGNTATCMATVTVYDTLAPVPDVASLPDVTAQCSATLTAPTATDNCDGTVTATTSDPTTYTTQGTFTVTWTYTDAAGNESTQTQNVIIDDTTPPVPDVASLPNVTGQCSATVPTPTATDNCDGAINGTTSDPTFYNTQGTFTVTWTYTDAEGNSSTQTQTVIIDDTTPPVPDVASLPDVTGQCSATIAGPPSATDNCDGPIVGTTSDPLTYTTQGTFTVTWTYTDAEGNSSTQTQTVIVDDTTPPVPDVASLPDLTGECMVTVPGPPTATDNCDGGPITGTTSDPLVYSTQGTFTITWTYTDSEGNSSTQTQTVIVDDVTAPVPIIPSLPTLTGECSVTASPPPAVDNCVGPVNGTTSDPTTYNTEGTYTITWTYDDGNGNTSTQTQMVIVDDVTAPVPDVASLPDATGECSVTVTAPTATDNCVGSVTGTTSDPTTYTTQGTFTVTWTYDDGNGNTATQNQTVIVDDVTPPTVTCHDTTVYLNGVGLASLAPADVFDSGSDNCAPSVNLVSVSPNSFNCSHIGAPQTVTLTVNDGNGNTATCTATITVLDTLAPVPNLASLPDATGECAVAVGAPTATDNCDGPITGTTSDPVVYTSQGTFTITWTYTDGQGNSSTQTQTVIVDDTTAPVPDVASLPTVTGECSATISVTPTATDNCAAGVSGTTSDPLTYNTQGTFTVTWTYDDGNGNTATQTQTVIVDDVTPPTAVCMNDTVYLDAFGGIKIKAEDLDGGSSDNCAIDTLIASMDSFTCANIGVNMVDLYVFDVGGNSDTCTATITVLDTIPPNVVCALGQPKIAYLTTTANAPWCEPTCPTGGDNQQILDLEFGAGNWDLFDLDTVVGSDVFNATYNMIIISGSDDAADEMETFINTYQSMMENWVADGRTLFLNAGPNEGDGMTYGFGGVQLSYPSFVSTGNASVPGHPIFNGPYLPVGTTWTGNFFGHAVICPPALGGTVLIEGPGGEDVLVEASWGSGVVLFGGMTIPHFHLPSPHAINLRRNIIAYMAGNTVPELFLGAGGTVTVDANSLGMGTIDNCDSVALTANPTSFNCNDLGSQLVTIIATDSSGNVDSCTTNVIVLDTIPPVAVCQNISVFLNASNFVTITPADVNNGSSDNCPIDTMYISIDSFTCAHVGDNSVTLYVEDAAGNIDSCVSMVTVNDTISPVAVCQNINLPLDGSGNATITPADVDGGSTDNCGIETLSIDVSNFDCADIGPNNVTLTVVDSSGNTSTCLAVVTVQDTTPPVFVCPADITTTTDPGICEAQVFYTVDVTDNCDTSVTPVFVTGSTSGSFFDVGVTIVTYTATDSSGNTATCTFNVVVNDEELPTPVCQNINVYLDGTGNVSFSGVDIDNGSDDACGIDTLIASPNSFTCADTGANNVTLIVIDNNGNVDSCTAIVTVLDTVPPVAMCQDTTVYLDANGLVVIDASFVDNGTTDNCQIDTLIVDIDSFYCADAGLNTVTMTATDIHGNVSTCTATVTVLDTIPPFVNCANSGPQIIFTDDFQAGAGAWTFGADSTTCMNDNTGGQNNWGLTDSTGGLSPVNLPTQWIGVKNNGDQFGAERSFITSPAIPVTAGMVQVEFDSYSANEGGGPIVVGASPDDLCDYDVEYVLISINGGPFLSTHGLVPGLHDGSDNTLRNHAFQSFVTPGDTIRYRFHYDTGDGCCGDDSIVGWFIDNVVVSQFNGPTFYLDSAGMVNILPSDIDNGSADSCGIASLSLSDSTFDCSDLGAGSTTTLYATDIHGNVDSCEVEVVIQDTIAPIAICQNTTVYLNASGFGSLTPGDIDNGSTDNCAIDLATLSQSGFTCADLGPNTVTLTLYDVTGNNSSCTATVTVEDSIPPVAICDDITVYLDGNGEAGIGPFDIDDGSSDNCAIDTIYIDVDSFFCANVGIPNPVVLTVIDQSGNMDTCSANVTVLDTIPPVAICQDIDVYLDGAGNASITPSDIDNGSTDNCAIASLAISQSTFDCIDVPNQTVTLTVTDVNGNISTCTSIVTVHDTIAPTALCQPVTIYLDGTGNASISVPDIDNGSSDACGVDTMFLSMYNFDCSMTGPNSVTLTVVDVNGNSSTCTSNVTVLDTIPPNLVCMDTTIYLDANGNALINPADVFDAGASTDNCITVTPISVGPNSFDCGDVGTNTVVLTAIDASGNIATCTATVTVLDTVPPTAICQDTTVYLGAGGTVSIDPSYINNGSADSCGIDSMFVSPANFACADTGANTVTLTVIDVNGNSSTCTATVTVLDTISPVAVCQTIDVYLDASGNATITAADVDGGSSDNCSIDSMAIDISAFTCSDIDTNVVVLTVFDPSGNSSNCNANVVVHDTIPPTAICQDTTIYLDAGGSATITVAMIDNGSNDACGIDSLGLSQAIFTCADTGANTVTLTVVDANGNSSTCTSTVTVLDTIPPTASCQDTTIYLAAGGSFTIDPSFVNDFSGDNCGVDTMYVSPSTFTCADTGANVVTLTIVDVNGNIDSCNATVTVIDTLAPIAVCKDTTVYLDASGLVMITPSMIDNGSSDNCPIDSMAVSPSSFACADTGANTVTLTVWDDNGNSSTCTATVTVLDTIPPTAICQDITVSLDGAGNATISPTDIDNGSNDNCGVASLSANITNFDCSDIGPNTVTLTVVDLSGNISTCTSIVTIIDDENPVAICPFFPITFALPLSGQVDISGAAIFNQSTDNCGIDSTVFLDALTMLPKNIYDCSDLGLNDMIIMVWDASGNSNFCTAQINIVDNIPAVVTCPSDITVSTDSANCDAVVTFADPTFVDNCPGATMVQTGGLPSGSVFPLGTTTNTYEVTDGQGNVSGCSFTITVIDSLLPGVSCPGDTLLSVDPGQCDAVFTYTIIASDNCPGDTLYQIAGLASGAAFPVGITTNTWVISDSAGNADTCSFTVTVVDDEAPVISGCPSDITVSTDTAICGQIVSWTPPTASDNCAVDSFTSNFAPGATFALGTNTVTYIAVDTSGNADTCSFTVTVIDSIPPVIMFCPSDITVATSPTSCEAIAAWFPFYGENDNCGIDTLYSTHYPLDTFQLGTTLVQVFAFDEAGNSDTCNFNIVVIDTTAPAFISCPGDITVPTDSGECYATVNWTPPSVDENCTIDTLYSNFAPGDTFLTGTHLVTYVVVDNSGLSDTCHFKVFVGDAVPPVIAGCPPDTLVGADPNFCGAILSWTAPTASDNCEIDTFYSNFAPGDTFPLGITNVIYIAVDTSGNADTCTFKVQVVDDVDPVITGCPGFQTESVEPGECYAIVSWTPPVASDNCELDTLFSNIYPGDTLAIGMYTVTYIAIDTAGNADTCSFGLEVVDDVDPIIVCPSDITVSADTGSCETVVTYTPPTGTDGCPGAVTTQIAGLGSGATFPVGTSIETFVVVDASGNSDTCSFNIVVIDDQDPVITCPADVTVYADSGTCQTQVFYTGASASDNCGTVNITLISGQGSGGFFQVGTTPETYLAEDLHGNTDTCTFLVVVLDTVPPVIVWPSDITVGNDSGMCDAVVNYTVPTSTDNCPDDSIYQIVGLGSGATFPVGTTIETYVAVDASGNSDTCSFSVTVQDTEAPALICPSDITVIAGMGVCDTVVNYPGVTAMDNCPGSILISLTGGLPSGAVFPVGTTVVTYTAQDSVGNLSSCSFSVVVEPFMPATPAVINMPNPVNICIDDTLQLDGSGPNMMETGTWTYLGPGGAFIPNPNDSAALLTDFGAAGLYTLIWTITDGCASSSDTIQVQVNPLPTGIIQVLDTISAFGQCDGRLGVIPLNGTPPYANYEWFGPVPQTGQIADSLCAGQYWVVITDNSGCMSDSIPFFMDEPDPTSLLVDVRVYLQAAYNPNTGKMDSILGQLPSFPLNEPYTALGYAPVASGSALSTTPTVLSATGDDAIVDWVIVELRDITDTTIVVGRQPGLLTVDGDIVSAADGFSSIGFNLPDGDYFVAVRHRNHLGVLGTNIYSLNTIVGTIVDFTNAGTPVRGTYAMTTVGDGLINPIVPALWGGDADNNKVIGYAGGFSEIPAIGFKVLLDPGNVTFSPTYTVAGYHIEDLTMDGIVAYAGALTEINLVGLNVFLHPANAAFSPTFTIIEQIP